jgi:EAL domain-containing protein (putative c-di-GMP-specific phosphodiesterase class I)
LKKRITFTISIIIALLALAWFIFNPSFEPAIVFLGSLIGFIPSIKDKQKSNNIEIPDKTWDMLCQPIIDIKTRKISSIEVLPNFKSKKSSFSYSELMLSVSKFNQVLPVTESFMTFAIKYAQYWHKNFDTNLIITLKLSNPEMLNTGYFELLVSIINKYNFPKKLICLELSEEKNFCEKTPEIIKKLTNLGVKVSLGNFGTGASDYSALRHLDIQKIIIPETFIENIEKDEISYSMVVSIIQVAKTLGLSTLAQGVINNEQFELLKELDCDELQGDFISPFIESNEILRFMLNYNMKNFTNPR